MHRYIRPGAKTRLVFRAVMNLRCASYGGSAQEEQDALQIGTIRKPRMDADGREESSAAIVQWLFAAEIMRPGNGQERQPALIFADG